MMAELRDPMALDQLLAGLTSVGGDLDMPIADMHLDSRQVGAGDLFLAAVGDRQDGRDYIDDAIGRGARAVVAESAGDEIEWRDEVPVIPLPDLRSKISEISARFFDHPSRHIKVVGITGTNGKTSCSWWLRELLQAGGWQAAAMGTLGMVGGTLEPADSQLTTPDAVTVQRRLAALRSQGMQAAIMEVSSHGLEQHRVDAVAFDLAILTNLSADHLDYHGDMASYGRTKARLFHLPGLKQALINLDDAFGRGLSREIGAGCRLLTYGVESRDADIRMLEADFRSGIRARLVTPWGEAEFANPHLFGAYNLANLLAVLGAACALGQPLAGSAAGIADLTPVPGRLEEVAGPLDDISVVVDFAHTPDAVASALASLRQATRGKLIAVLGAGGNRDRAKRPQMAAAAGRYADLVILTADNPRDEDPVAIAEEMAGGLTGDQYRILPDRQEAIEAAVKWAESGGCVAILGKGHETSQVLGNESRPFSDQACGRRALAMRRERMT